MTYYVGTMPVGEHLSHHGIKGMRWGQRRYQNPDGSLTAAGRVRYGVSNAYSRVRSGARNASGRSKSWYKKNEKKIKRAAKIAGATAAVAGTAYLGARYGKSALKAAGKLHTRVGMMRGMTGGAFKKAGRGVKSAFGRVKRSKAVTGARMAGYEVLGRADNALQRGRKSAKYYGNKAYIGFNKAKNRTAFATKYAGSKAKGAARKAGSAIKSGTKRATAPVRGAYYEALGRVDNAIQRAKRGGIQFDAKYAASRVKGAARKAGGTVKGAANKVKRSKAVTKARMAGYEALGRADNAAQKARKSAKRVGKAVRTKIYSAGARASLKNGVYRSTHSSKQIARRAGIKAGTAVGSGTAAYIVRRKKKKSRK